MSIATLELVTHAVPVAIITDPAVTPLEYRMYSLFGALEAAGLPSPPMAKMAIDLRVSVPTVWRAVTALDAAGWITRTRQPPGATLTQVHPVRLTTEEREARTAARQAAEVARAEAKWQAKRDRARTRTGG